MIWYKALFSFQGRLNRKGFWIGVGLNFLFLLIMANFIIEIETLTTLTVLPLFVSMYSFIAIIIKRLHDRNRSAKALFILVVPILCYFTSFGAQGKMAWALGVVMPVFISTTLLLEWGCFKSFPDANEYGEQGLSITFKE
ncbi:MULTISPECIES: DUF805 domain-containing protein [Pasteurellaceae]|uniref:DUF805 domain-containing protein n=1 Tax=Pasteurella atlantica TaxID=2827233 RepID=A0AAW8CR34_9PAST|nr:DUF805 domain-containing protein [Pasteurella atlantica]MBR0573392.1 DUF805 domain-containing protein [Pasteurella atlantica]MDP8039800.1 DUF805 domain-containing protein [Pasteurella atlantica]MDP8041817.1 DUF805 domain-containing protein [Pasteurella atlantica]MDP8043884.1 DUF805 domain-containing protein [Pasteurella atlantica]MDP8046113.1 DUF805 domain-containing protein [Pasteurella atlantica]